MRASGAPPAPTLDDLVSQVEQCMVDEKLTALPRELVVQLVRQAHAIGVKHGRENLRRALEDALFRTA